MKIGVQAEFCLEYFVSVRISGFSRIFGYPENLLSDTSLEKIRMWYEWYGYHQRCAGAGVQELAFFNRTRSGYF